MTEVTTYLHSIWGTAVLSKSAFL